METQREVKIVTTESSFMREADLKELKQELAETISAVSRPEDKSLLRAVEQVFTRLLAE